MVKKYFLRTFMDIRDDWILDRFRYIDVLKTDEHLNLSDVKEMCSKDCSHGMIFPPKRKDLVRQTETLPIYVRVAQTRAIDKIYDFYNKHYNEQVVYSYKMNDKKSKYIFKHYYNEWKNFQAKKNKLSNEYRYCCQADISSFYPLIREKYLSTSLKELGASSSIQKTLLTELQRIEFIEKNGLPQNNDFSAMLSNMMLFPVDRFLREDVKVEHIRYADDFFIFCKTFSQAVNALASLQQKLRSLGLVINTQKTQVCLSSDLPGDDLKGIDGIQALLKAAGDSDLRHVHKAIIEQLGNVIFNHEKKSKSLRMLVNRLSYTSLYLGRELLEERMLINLTKLILEEYPKIATELFKLLCVLELTKEELASINQEVMHSPFSYVRYLNSFMRLVKSEFRSLPYPCRADLERKDRPLTSELVLTAYYISLPPSKRPAFASKLGKLQFWESRRLAYTYVDRLGRSGIRKIMKRTDYYREKYNIESVEYLLSQKSESIAGIERFCYVASADLESYF